MSAFSNKSISLQDLPQYQNLPINKLEKKYWLIILINVLFFGILITSSLSIFVFYAEKFKDKYPILMLTLFCIIALILWLLRISFKKRGFALREKDIVYKGGILVEKTTIIPINRIQHVALHQGFISRYLNLASLAIYTAGLSGEMHINGLSINQASQLKEFLLNNIKPNDGQEDI